MMLFIEIFRISQLDITHQDVLFVIDTLCMATVGDAGFDIFRKITLVFLYIIGIRTESTQLQSVEDGVSQATVYIYVCIQFAVFDFEAAHRVLDFVCHRVFIPFAFLIPRCRECRVVGSCGIECLLVVVRIIYFFQRTEHTELNLQLIVEHGLHSVQLCGIVAHSAVLDNTLLVD